ncbi:MAG: class I fructose-bisphosphate aldolase, partial [Candidatus Latescibacteria bacterium]|nr:class I fructose-bisphosphate aldolase [Candidatus Latescibacterota bacterium]
MSLSQIQEYLGDDADALLSYEAKVSKDLLSLPGPDFVDRVFGPTDRIIPVLSNLQRLYGSGRLANTGYVSILPIDQGIEHSGGASFAPNPIYFDPENIVKLAIEGGCNAVATTLGVLGMVSRRYAHKIPMILKFNHNQLMTYPSQYDQVIFGQVEQAWQMGCAGVGATIYFGSDEANRQIVEISEAFARAHELGMFTVLWCYLRNSAFKTDEADYHEA